MNRKSGSGSGPFLMEMLVVVGFFMICASICVLVFVKADRISREARDTNQAVEKAESLAEELKAGQEPQWSAVLPGKDDKDEHEEMHALYWDREWRSVKPSGSAPYLGIVCRNTADGMEQADIVIMRYGIGGREGSVLYHLQTKTYAAP